MRLSLRVAILLAAAGLASFPSTAEAQRNNNNNNRNNGFGGGGFGGGFPGGFGGGGFGGNQQQIMQLAPQNLRSNWYMYDSIGGMGRTGGTVQIVTQFGLQSQQGAQGGGGGFGGGGFGGGYGGYGGGLGGYPGGFYGVNYQRQLAYQQAAYQQALYQQQAMANNYNQSYATAAAMPLVPDSATNRPTSFRSFGFPGSGSTGFGAFASPTNEANGFDPLSFQPRKVEATETEKTKSD